jgi:hypothetical protein
MNDVDPIAIWVEKLGRFHSEAVGILSAIESATVRRFSLDNSYQQLKSLNLQEDELFRQSLRCVELQVYRAAHVMAWCGFFDCILRLFESDGFRLLKSVRSNWAFSSREELTESFSEHQIIEALKPAAVIGKADQKALIGLLSRRNECAHPTAYFPDLNQTLGYISEIFARLSKIEKNYPGFVI